jgi:hypothetical protein
MYAEDDLDALLGEEEIEIPPILMFIWACIRLALLPFFIII